MPGGQGGPWYTNTYNDEPDEEKGLSFHLCCYRDVLLQAIRHYGIINKPTIPAEDDADAVAHATCSPMPISGGSVSPPTFHGCGTYPIHLPNATVR
ncbi:hypothetical protein ABVK25_004996 [Lepraria finkii]|uniref:Uncharacterized protein n=1 Tax=Lepraria finkii TaxID=1340010 RepID=A0ABR4BB81_9LECA